MILDKIEHRDYQMRVCASVRGAFSHGQRSALVVSPTGSGKSIMEGMLVEQMGGPALVVTHRREIVVDVANKFRRIFGDESVGVVAADLTDRKPAERVVVASIQSLLAREFDVGRRPKLVLLDEAHHYLADQWGSIRDWIGTDLLCGFTATPQRADGKALGDMFQGTPAQPDAPFVAAQAPELIARGYLVPTRIIRSAEDLGNDLVMSPLEAWRFAENSRTIVFLGRVPHCARWSREFTDHRIPAAYIEAETPKQERDETLASFRAGETKVLCNVYVMTEGVDIPEARTVILARGFEFAGSFLQAMGRARRPFPGKKDAILIDLTGTTHTHGNPDREYTFSLSGRPIKAVDAEEDDEQKKSGRVWAQEIVGGKMELFARGSLGPDEPLPPGVELAAPDKRRSNAEAVAKQITRHRGGRDLVRKHAAALRPRREL